MNEMPTISNLRLTPAEIKKIKKNIDSPLLDADSNLEYFIITLPEKKVYILKRSECIFNNIGVGPEDYIRGILYRCEDPEVSSKESLTQYFEHKKELDRMVEKYLSNSMIDKIVVSDHQQTEDNTNKSKLEMLEEFAKDKELSDLDKNIISKKYYEIINKAKEARNKKQKGGK